MRSIAIILSLASAALLLACSPETPTAPPPKPPDEAAAIAALKETHRAQADFIRRTRRYAQTFDELIADHLLDAEPTLDTTGYNFLLLPSPDAVSYTVKATPSTPEARHFFMDQTGAIRAETGKPATVDSPGI